MKNFNLIIVFIHTFWRSKILVSRFLPWNSNFSSPIVIKENHKLLKVIKITRAPKSKFYKIHEPFLCEVWVCIYNTNYLDECTREGMGTVLDSFDFRCAWSNLEHMEGRKSQWVVISGFSNLRRYFNERIKFLSIRLNRWGRKCVNSVGFYMLVTVWSSGTS